MFPLPRSHHCLLLVIPIAILLFQQARGAEAPATEPLSTQFAVTVNGHDVPVYLARVVALSPEQREKLEVTAELGQTSQASFASFDVAGAVQVEVRCPQAVGLVKMLPRNCGIKPLVSGNVIKFSVAKAGQLVLEVNGDWVHSLQLFADPPEIDVPRADDPNVIYFAPGVHEIDSMKVGSGKTVYLARGAVVYAKPTATKASTLILEGSNITLRGRGILDGSLVPRGGRSILGVWGQRIRVKGVILRDACAWTFQIGHSNQIDVDDVKVFGWRGNSDGIDICNSSNVNVHDCYIRSYDDLVVIKTNIPDAGPSENVTVRHCVLWNELAHALSLGAELRAPVRNVLFEDCDIVHDKGREWDLRVYQCDAALVKDIVFDDIRIEESRRLMSLWIGKAMWSTDAQRGHIENVTFRDITSVMPERSSSAPAELRGYDADHAIDRVLFDRVQIGGRALTRSDVKQNAFVEDVRIEP